LYFVLREMLYHCICLHHTFDIAATINCEENLAICMVNVGVVCHSYMSLPSLRCTNFGQQKQERKTDTSTFVYCYGLTAMLGGVNNQGETVRFPKREL
jgi:hypothetical protein